MVIDPVSGRMTEFGSQTLANLAMVSQVAPVERTRDAPPGQNG